MKKTPLFLQILTFSSGLLWAGPNLQAQSPTPSAPPAKCPNPGWSEGLIQYTHFNPPSAFPTQDTKYSQTTDCVFHEWSWEAFVWATAMDSNGQPRFLGLGNLDAIGKSSTAAKGTKAPLVLKPRNVKPRGAQQDLQGDQQAGSNGLLVDQNGQVVWYSAHANPLYYNLVQKYYGAQAFAKASPTLQFPVGAAVFKASWQIVPDGTKPTAVFTTPALVPLLVANSNGGVTIDQTKTRPVTVALVGLHVVGVTVNHPEFLWGSFEQVQNAPDLADPNGYNSPTPVSSNGFTFYAANTPANACNPSSTSASVTLTDPVKQTLSPITNVFRQYAYGGESTWGVQEIDNLNSQSQSALSGMTNPAEHIWANYKLIGTTWISGNTLQPGDGTLNSQAIGSLDLANATLETFVQGPQNLGTNANCFACHNTGANSSYNIPGKDINLSHKVLEPMFNNPALKRIAPGKPAPK